MEKCTTHTMVRPQNPAPDMVTIIEGQGMACIAPWQMYDVRFVNDGPFPVKLYWSRTSRNDLGVWTRAVQGPSVAIGTGGSTTLPNFCIDGDLEVLAVPASSTSPAPTWDGDWATQVPDGLYIYSPASDPVNKAFNITKPPYTFTFTLDGKITPGQKVIDQPPTTMATLTLQQPRVLCGDWIEVPGGDVIMGIPVTHVTGFRAYPEACAAYCAGNPTLCDDAKLTACGVQKGPSVWGATSPECACLLGSASEVALPSTAGLTYTKFKNFLATLPGLTFPPDVCWYPGCIQDGALHTSTSMGPVTNNICPKDIQACIAYIGNLDLDTASNNKIALGNYCSQGGSPPVITLPPGPSGPGSGPSGPGPASQRKPIPPGVPDWIPATIIDHSREWIIGTILVVVVVLVLAIGLGVGLKKHTPPSVTTSIQ
jgi:hypothetical protein